MKNKKICDECIDRNCVYKNSDDVKFNCPANEIPAEDLLKPQNEKFKPRNVDFTMAKIHSKVRNRVKFMHPACAECDELYVSCFGRTISEWNEILDNEELNETEVSKDCCWEIVNWEHTHET